MPSAPSESMTPKKKTPPPPASNLPEPTLGELTAALREFTRARDWDEFHTPKNLTTALMVESAELAEIFTWCGTSQSRQVARDRAAEVADEIADVLIYLLLIADAVDCDLIQAALHKVRLNEERYPVDRSKGKANKYNDL